MTTTEAGPTELASDVPDPYVIPRARISEGALVPFDGDISQPEISPGPVRFYEVALSALSDVAGQVQDRLLVPLERTTAKLRKAH